MIKEKSKNKTKKKQNINPLPKINQNNNNYTIRGKQTNNKYISESKKNNDLDFLKVNYQKDQKRILPKTNLKQKNPNSAKNSNNNTLNKNRIKLGLKYLLKEFGLIEYYKKFNEIGYNNDNYIELGNLTKKNFNSILNLINILPFHYEKFEKFYDYVKRLNHSNNNNKKIQNQNYLQEPNSTTTPNPKRRFNFNYNYNSAINSLNSSNKLNYNINENTKTNQMYNQYQNYYNNYIGNNNINLNHNSEYDLNKNMYNKTFKRKTLNINRGREKRNYIKAKSRPRPHTSNPKLYLKDNNNNYNNKNQIFKLRIRNNYSGKKIIKKKLNNFSLINSPYLNNSIDDTSSLIHSYFNDYQNLAENHKMNLINQHMNNIYKIQNNNNIKNNPDEIINNFDKNQNNKYVIDINQFDYENNNSENIERMLNHYMVQLNEKLDKSFDSIEDSSLSHIITSQMNENSNQNTNLTNNLQIEKIKPNPDYKLPKIISEENKSNINKNINPLLKNDNSQKINNNEEIKNNNEEKIKEVLKKIEGESSKDIKRLSDHDMSTKSKDSKEQIIDEVEEKKYISKEEAEKLLSDVNCTLTDKKYIMEQNIYETLRLNKSFDEENNNKETIKFDIEFICRCLGLALMKLIEQGQEKEHITELFFDNNENNNKYPFMFFSEEFNNNIFLIKEFFNENNNNNDKKILGEKNLISILEQFYMKKNEYENNAINIISHLKKSKDENYILKDDDNIDNINKINSIVLDMDNELKFLGHYFSYRRPKVKDYQGLSENTKKILGKDLSYIKEIDSEVNRTLSKKANNSESNLSKSNNKTNNNNNENNSVLNDSKNNQENMNKILDDSGEYEDEFLKEKNIEDLKEEDNNNENNNEIKSEDLNIKSEKDNDNVKDKEENIITSKYNNKLDSENINNNISLRKPPEQITNPQDIESSYIIDVETIKDFKLFLLSKFEVFDEDYIYFSKSIVSKRLMQPPDPQTIFEFCANIMLLTKMEKETIVVALIYIERLIFNTGLLITLRNWRKIIFTALIIASKIWDDDSLENVHYSQIFSHLKIGEINLLERTFLEFINYKVFVKYSEFMKYYFSVKEMCLKYNYNGEKIVEIKPEKVIRIQEYRYQLQKRMNKTLSLNNSASF